MSSDGAFGPSDGDSADLDRIAAGAVTTLTLLVAFSLLAFDVPWFWVAFPVGFGGVLPLAIGLARRYERGRDRDRERDRPGEYTDERETALSTLRDRYARGEIDEVEFERRVERLLETETVADAGEFLDDRNGERGDATAGPAREREPVPEAERDSNR
jgi:uncharacterized membrane protein